MQSSSEPCQTVYWTTPCGLAWTRLHRAIGYFVVCRSIGIGVLRFLLRLSTCAQAIDAVAAGANRELFSEAEFIWAHGHVRARAMKFGWRACSSISEGDPGRLALLPVVDLLNHSPLANSSVARADGGWRITGGVPFRSGEQVPPPRRATPALHQLMPPPSAHLAGFY